MSRPNVNLELLNEEERIVKWFLRLFYFIMFSYDFCYYYIIPKLILHKPVGFPSNYCYITYIVFIGLVPVAYYVMKRQKYYLIKYIYLISYVLTTGIVEILTFYGKSITFESGNIVEIFLILFAPLFINSRYFWLSSLGMIFRYALVGIIIQSSYVVIPIILIFILSLMGFISLDRFKGYVNAIKSSYDKQLNEIVKGIIATLELKDPYTRGHSERVAGYALSLVKQTGELTEEEMRSFNYACLLHDIGKINIPDRILMKPSRLTNEEYDVIKTHPAVGAEAVKNFEGLKNNIGVIRSHHERWDGKGYPDQLQGEEIPYLARVTAIADAFDAMTSSRSYRPAMSLEKAYKVIIEGKGSQFDPQLVEQFKDVFPQWMEFHKKYPWAKKNELHRG